MFNLAAQTTSALYGQETATSSVHMWDIWRAMTRKESVMVQFRMKQAQFHGVLLEHSMAGAMTLS